MTRGRFITFEGVDGSGKSSHINRVACALRVLGLEVVETREIGGTPVGEQLRGMALSQDMSSVSEVLLALASRIEHQNKVITPALGRGAWVVCDRYSDSTLAYQIAGKMEIERYLAGEGEDTNYQYPKDPLHGLCDSMTWAVDDRASPDLTLFFDLPNDMAEQRRGLRAGQSDRFESESDAYFDRVATAYRNLAKAMPNRIKTIDSSLPIGEVATNVLKAINDYYRRVQPIAI